MQEWHDAGSPGDGNAELQEFLARVRKALDHHERSQADLARALGVRAATVSDWFTGKSVPSGLIMLRLPQALGVRPAWLFTGDGSVTASADADLGPGDPGAGGSAAAGDADRIVSRLRSLLHELDQGEG